jgi:hypothetical protein
LTPTTTVTETSTIPTIGMLYELYHSLVRSAHYKREDKTFRRNVESRMTAIEDSIMVRRNLTERKNIHGLDQGTRLNHSEEQYFLEMKNGLALGGFNQ